MKYISLALFSDSAQTGENLSNEEAADAVRQNTGEGDSPAAEEALNTRTRREIYDEFIRANKDFYTDDTQKLINRRFKEAKATENALKAAYLKLEELEKNKVTPIPPSDDFLQAHPEFTLEKELENDTFRLLYEGGLDTDVAYNAAHLNEIIENVRKEAESATMKLCIDNVIARGVRVRESAAVSTYNPGIKRDVSKLTKSERALLARRVASGENISFN